MDERVLTPKKCWIGIEMKTPEISREVELHELVESETCLDALEEKSWDSEKSWNTEERSQNIVMKEKNVNNSIHIQN